MPIYKIDDERISPIERTTFGNEGLRERQKLQQLLKIQIVDYDMLDSGL